MDHGPGLDGSLRGRGAGPHLEARQGGCRCRAHGGARDCDGLGDVKERHCCLNDTRVGMQCVARNGVSQASRVREVLCLKALIPPV